MGATFESILKTTLADSHSIVAGVKLAAVQFGPSQRQQFMVASESTTLNGGFPNGYKYAYVTDAAEDDTSGIYVEDSFSATDKLTLVGGLSYEYNDYVEVGGKLMPRGAVIYDLTKELSAKVCYNSGYERPPVDKKFHKIYGFVTKAESVEETDYVLSYQAQKTRATVTAFNYRIYNYFTWTILDAATGLQGHANNGNGKSGGVEVDVHQSITNSLSVSGNYTYAYTRINDVVPVGDPSSLYDLGAAYYLSKDMSFDVNVNGWINMPNGYPNDGAWGGGGEELVDVSIVMDNLCHHPLCLTLFGHNVFNVTSRVGMTGWPGYTDAEGSSYGIKLSYKL
jgi:outer membrane receptor protein involved in Fe transport